MPPPGPWSSPPFPTSEYQGYRLIGVPTHSNEDPMQKALLFQINQRNMIQGAIQSGTDMAPWYAGALATGFFGWRCWAGST